MKFFVVILAVIGIQLIGDSSGQSSTESYIMVTVNSLRDLTTSTILRVFHTYDQNTVKFYKDVKPGDLTFFMELSVNNEVIMEATVDDPHDFCENSVEGDILRSALVPEGETSCPINKGDYTIRMPYDAYVSDPQKLTQMKCGLYTGLVDIREGADNTFFEMEFEFMLDENDKCKK